MGEFPNKSTQFTSTSQPKKNGRPKGSPSISVIIRKVLESKITMDSALAIAGLTDNQKMKLKKTILEHGFERQALQWLNGDVNAGEKLIERGYGKVQEPTPQIDVNITNSFMDILHGKTTKSTRRRGAKKGDNKTDN